MQLSTLLLALVASVGLTSAVVIPEPTSLDAPKELASLALTPRGKSPGGGDPFTLQECFKTGLALDKKSRYQAEHRVREACRVTLKGEYLKKSRKRRCLPLTDGNSIKFMIRLAGQRVPELMTLSEEVCVSGLLNLVKHCDKGGKTIDKHWKFEFEPTYLKCPKWVPFLGWGKNG
ncbi:hypothetical protein F5X68DRAFT_228210 [Plectosphaerella plurivora]|uniref:Uncharacterized protein n=1 Tax=Plectosphaerella plurivora TaxID=936078 RepID=A0A9P9ABU8_9PEZI|nr:hypothetical protein F5X68DRAFT_228210 [Plectosphaerella plurivora]